MGDSYYITITARYDPHGRGGRSLASIAPGLLHAGLLLVDDHLDRPVPTRTWAGFVEEETFGRFSTDWMLEPQEPGTAEPDADDGTRPVLYTRTLDGMKWGVDGESPITSVSVMVVHQPGDPAARHRS